MVKILNRLTQSDAFFRKIFLITAWKPKKMDIQKKKKEKKRESNAGVIKVSHVSNDPSS